MGRLEEESKRKKRKGDLQHILLGTVKAAGVLSVGLLAPNVLGAMGRLGLIPTKSQTDSIRNSRNHLIRQGFLKWEGRYLRITKEGEMYLQRLELLSYQFDTPKRWDKRWRVLIFDIPEYRKGLRDKIRYALCNHGFIRLQDSVWVYPYPCEDFVNLLKAEFKIGKDLLYLIVDTLEHDEKYRNIFKLS